MEAKPASSRVGTSNRQDRMWMSRDKNYFSLLPVSSILQNYKTAPMESKPKWGRGSYRQCIVFQWKKISYGFLLFWSKTISSLPMQLIDSTSNGSNYFWHLSFYKVKNKSLVILLGLSGRSQIAFQFYFVLRLGLIWGRQEPKVVRRFEHLR